jgi:preprotein translocase subunit SecB
MEAGKIASFRFESFKIIKSYFEMNDGEVKTFSIGFEPRGILFKSESKFKLELDVLIEEESRNFKAEITAVGIFIFDADTDITLLNKLFYVNAPAILFPYVRAYLSTLTTLSGLKPINLPTLNLSNLGAELQKNTTIN